MLTLQTIRRPSLASTFLCCSCLVTLASADAVEVSRNHAISETAHWTPATQDQTSRAAPVGMDDPATSDFNVVDDEVSFVITDPALPCDACPDFLDVHAVCNLPSCCGTGRFWGRAEYLYWHMLGMENPPLVTSSSTGTARDDAGFLGQPATTILLGNDRFVDDGQSGGRFGFGFWLDRCRDIGVDFIYTKLGDSSDSWSVTSDQVAILARPFFNIDTALEDARLLAFPGEVSGGVQVEGSADYDVYELLIRRPVSRFCRAPTYIVYGYRAAELDDSLRISDFSQSLSGATSGSSVQSLDSFRSRNVFHGFEAGIHTDFRLSECWQLGIEGKVAFGETDHKTTISGTSTATNSQGDSTTTAGGLLTQSSNIGTFESNSHGVVQELTIRLQRSVWRGMTGSIGYTVHRWNQVARAGEQIDRSVNPTQIPPGTLVGEARPEHPDTTSNFVVQGITVGLGCTW